MSYFTKINSFANIKSLWENSQKETVNLEFKADVSSNSDEIAKDVSSFANGEGGQIIYGLQEDTKKGIAIKSSGIDLQKKDERIQQIVSSSIAPELMVRIDVIQVTDEGSQQVVPDKGFILVKIPKSELYIHQVTTTGRYYVRNNTQATPYKYEPQELKESDIEYRYRRRLENRKRIEDGLAEKRRGFSNILPNAGFHLFLAAVPSAINTSGTKIDKALFNKLLFTKEKPDDGAIYDSECRYRQISDTEFYFQNRPTGYGRIAARANKTLTIEINDDGSAFVFQPLSSEKPLVQWGPLIFSTIEFMALTKRMYSELHYYGGVTTRFVLSAILHTDRDGNVTVPSLSEFGSVDFFFDQSSGTHVRLVTVDQHFQLPDFDLKEAMNALLVRVFESLGIENLESRYPTFLRAVRKYADETK